MQDDKDFKDYIDTLPAEIKQAIYSIDYPQKLQEIVRNNKLMIDQAGKLETETTLVMAGIEPMNKYVNNLISNVGLSSIQASVIAHDVNESIFKNIRETLKKINDQIIEEDKTLTEAETPTKENIITGIENPENIKSGETSISISSLSSTVKPEIHPEMADEGIEIKVNHLPEVPPNILPTVSTKNGIPSRGTASFASKPAEPFHQNISPIPNIVESKLTNTVIVPKETVVVEEKTKLPQKPTPSNDPYREQVS